MTETYKVMSEMEKGRVEIDCFLSVLLFPIGSSCTTPAEEVDVNLRGGVELSEKH